MKKRLLKTAASFICAAGILISSTLAAGLGTGSAVYKNTTELTSGFTYENSISFNASGRRVESHLVDIAADSAVYPITLACDTIYGGLTITQMIDYAEALGYNVLGAVNSDFYHTSTKIPLGMVVEDGIYKSSPDWSNALAISDDGAFVSQMPTVWVTLTNETGERAGQGISTTRLNKTRDISGMFIFTEHFSTVSTRTTTDGWMVRMKILEGSLSVGGEMKLEVTELYQGSQAQKIGEGNIILTAETACGLESQFEKFQVGDIVTLTTHCTDERLSEAKWVTGCGNILALNGQLNAPENWDSAILGLNPRTAVGIRDDGSMVFYTVDGRSSLSTGATMQQLAEDLLSMGCTTVVNLDGGGSTTLSLRSGKTGEHTIINVPSDGSPRRVAGYILFVTDGEAGGKRLFLNEDGQYVLTGATLDLGTYCADNALIPAHASGVSYKSARGTLNGTKYTAPSFACLEIITLSCADAVGQGELYIVDKADSLTVKNAATGAGITSITLAPGESLKLGVGAKKLGRDVCIDGTRISYSCSDGIGSVTSGGVFTASGSGVSGSITVEAAGLSVTIPVYTTCAFSDISSHWAKTAIEALYNRGIVSGTGEGSFSPDADMKRGDFILMLYRACGSPEVSANSAYTDVPADSYYAKAIGWAQHSGIAFGNGDGTFSPEATLTREQAFTFVYRALGQLKINSPEPDTALLAQFSDGDSVSPYAKNAVSALIELGVVSGSDGKLEPQNTLTRAQMARVLYSCLHK